MADPLSVSASILGLITAGAKISQVLAQVVRKARRARGEFRNVQAEVASIQAILSQLQNFLLGTQRASRSRTSLIMVDQVIATLATCVTTFSELDSFAKALKSESDLGLLDRVRWIVIEGEFKEILARLVSHKTSLNLILTILTCQKQEDAEDKVDRLYDLVQQTLASSLVLAQRLDAFERTHTQAYELALASGLALDIPPGDEELATDLDDDENDPGTSTLPDSSMWGHHTRESAFEKLLVNSRAYKNAPHYISDAFSAISSARQTGSWSILSGLSLSEISHIGVLAIPIYETDLSNKEDYAFNTLTVGSTASAFDAGPSMSSQRQSREVISDVILEVIPEADRESLFSFDDSNLGGKQPFTLGPALSQITVHAETTVKFLELGQDGQVCGFVFGCVPAVMFEVGEFIKQEGIYAKEIFSRKGDRDHIMQLQKAADTSPGYGENLTWDGYTVYDAAAFLIRHLETLPVLPHWLPRHLLTLAVERVRVEPEIHWLIKKLPHLNRGILLYLADLLAGLAKEPKINGITTAHATIFRPLFFMFAEYVEPLIKSRRYIFCPVDDEPAVRMANEHGNSQVLDSEIGLAI
ncbi:Rho GTPase activation protein [Xylaria sp. FL1042]|nr:Rho GTPase activation protein [Xylaria sp. FL1042]